MSKLTECPVVNKDLIDHLELLFNSIIAKDSDPQLSQKLMIQMGRAQVLEYLNSKYKQQRGSNALNRGY